MTKKLTPNKAREILHDKTANGHPLTDAQRKFFGAMSKGNTLKMYYGGQEGYTDIPFKYNAAWNGQFQMGGGLPGATGFMYARTGAPSNGKYAKKTKPSAQNGINTYYQQGLDFKTKGMEQGGWLSKYIDGGIKKDDSGYWNPDNWGKPVEIGSNNITMKGVDIPLLGISDAGDIQHMQPGKDYKFKGKKVTEFPMKQGGQLTKLDQLTNFTNYNKPEMGGWLSKYTQ